MSNLLRNLLMGIVAVFCSLNVIAHQQKAAITSIAFNPRTDTIEVTHRFSLHDAEHAVKRVLDKQADIYSSEKTQARFADYVYQHFSIKQATGEALAFRPVGFELEGKFFWVYQEAPTPANSSTWLVTQNALQEIWPSQINTVNIDFDDKVRTLTLSHENPSQLVTFPADP